MKSEQGSSDQLSSNATQGPWKVTWPGPVPYIQCPAEGCFVAACFKVRDQTAANARLLAAAPDMLAALQVLLPGLILDRRYADEDDDIDALNSRIDTVVEAIRKAIGNG